MNLSKIFRNPFEKKDAAGDAKSSVLEVEMKEKDKKEVKKELDEPKLPEKSKEQVELEESEKKTAELRAKVEQEKKDAETVEDGGSVDSKLIKEMHQMIHTMYEIEMQRSSLIKRKE